MGIGEMLDITIQKGIIEQVGNQEGSHGRAPRDDVEG
jgi:hypothetical protein